MIDAVGTSDDYLVDAAKTPMCTACATSLKDLARTANVWPRKRRRKSRIAHDERNTAPLQPNQGLSHYQYFRLAHLKSAFGAAEFVALKSRERNTACGYLCTLFKLRQIMLIDEATSSAERW